jgi:FlaA1/EpsC-like NDP-sugar epimerase
MIANFIVRRKVYFISMIHEMGADQQAPTSVVVVGAGLAGASVCEGLRRASYTGPIVVVGDELDRPYDRPPLSK